MCVMKVKSGRFKLMSHAVLFPKPVGQIYRELPPPKKDIDKVLAVYYSGPNPPDPKLHNKVPLLVRKNAVAQALQWLIRNHEDYQDVTINDANLEEYEDDAIPVKICFTKDDYSHNRTEEGAAVNDGEAEEDKSGSRAHP